ncbi:hypothetical protein NDU88_004472 [Pleurodeles waltl]|uniref:Protein phosphatase 1 regulatory subunit 15B n=1 Tax=Pleurodeles waltl TaxID=8319 RepID=A0AAV7QC21_PLEWA|nr:hypothetical protein NDU88_004472 [Pleurodeles waltl]
MPRFQASGCEACLQGRPPRGDGMDGLSTSSRRPGAWIRSLARLVRPLPALLLRLLLGLPARWLQLVALVWGALLGRDRLLLHAEEEENEWQEMLHALGGEGLHPQGLYLGTDPLLWESTGKCMSSDVLEGLSPDLLAQIPTELLEGLPAELMHHHLKMIGADEGPLQMQTFPGFRLVSCMLGAHWADYQACGKDTGAFTMPYSQEEECKEPSCGKHSPWQSPDRELHTSIFKLGSKTAKKWAEPTEFVSRTTELPKPSSKSSESTDCVNKRTQPHRPARQWTESPMTANKKTEPTESICRETNPLTYANLKAEPTMTAWEQRLEIARDKLQPNTGISEISGTGPPVLLTELLRSGSDHVPQSLVAPSETPDQAATEGPGSLTSDCDATTLAIPELQLIRTKRLDFLQQLSKSDLLPSPDQDHGYCSLEENLLVQQHASAHVSSDASLSSQHQDHDTPTCTKPHPCHGQDNRAPSSCEASQACQHQGSNTSREGSKWQSLGDTRESLKESGQLYTRVASDHDGDGIDSDIEEDLPVPVRPVCSNKLIDYILGADSGAEDSSNSDADWDEEEGDDGFGSEGSLSVPEDSGDLYLWKSFSSQDPYNPQNFTASIETAQRGKEEPVAEGSDLSDSSDSEESSWGESSPGSACSSSEGEDSESECSADEEENLKLWNSFNNSDDPYNPLHFKASFQTVPNTKPVGCTYKGFKLGTIGAHSCGLLPPQVQPNEISGVGLGNPVNSDPSCGGSRKTTLKKVTFLDEVTEHYVGNEDRKGPWEEYARDRCRFQKRIQETECAIGHCFSPQHRMQRWYRIQKEHCS